MKMSFCVVFRSKEAILIAATSRILIVDDYEPFRFAISAMLRKQSNLQVIGEAVDGEDAVQKAQQLQPDLVLLDIGLPALDGLKVARRIRELSPKSEILFVSDHRCWDIAEEALRIGAAGYVVKSNAASELLAAVDAVLGGKPFLSAILDGSKSLLATMSKPSASPEVEPA
jgi:DNA-binding NarL/FixJ family response regulator